MMTENQLITHLSLAQEIIASLKMTVLYIYIFIHYKYGWSEK
jgi:hypothetical protein